MTMKQRRGAGMMPERGRYRQRTARRDRHGAMEIIEVLIAVLMIVAIFALVVMMNARFSSTIDTYMPFRIAVLVANRLSGSPELTIPPSGSGGAHKNILSAARLDEYVQKYSKAMPPDAALLCFHWRARVKEPDTYLSWEFGHDPMSDIPAQLLSTITDEPEKIYDSIKENPINVFKFIYPSGVLAGDVLKDMIEMAPASYSLPVSVATDADALTCVSAGGKCDKWDPVFGNCWPSEEPADRKDCDLAGGVCVAGLSQQCCCVKKGFARAGQAGVTLPAMLEVSVWKAKSECRDAAIIQKIFDETKASAGG